MKLCPNFVTAVMSLGTCGSSANPPPMGIPSPVAGNGSVFHRLGPQIPSSSVLGHGQPLPVQGPSKDSSAATIVDPEQAPYDDSSNGWIAVEPRRKSKKHTSNFPKGKKVLEVAAASVMSLRRDVPSDCAGVVNSLGTGAVIDADVDLGATSCMATPILGEDILATTPSDVPPLGELVNHNRKLLIQQNFTGSKRVPPSHAPQ